MCALVIDTSIALRPDVRLWVHLWAFWQWWACVVDRVVGATAHIQLGVIHGYFAGGVFQLETTRVTVCSYDDN